MITYYNGWTIYYTQFGSQNWIAERFGVSMRVNSQEALKRMIDTKNKIMRQSTNLEKGLV